VKSVRRATKVGVRKRKMPAEGRERPTDQEFVVRKHLKKNTKKNGQESRRKTEEGEKCHEKK